MKVAVFASGFGSNFECLLHSFAEDKSISVAALVSDNPESRAIELAKNSGLETYVFQGPPKFKRLSEEEDLKILDFLKKEKIDLVVLAGYMRLVNTLLVKAFQGRMINLHPSLLPAFKGVDAVGQALKAGVKVTGVTVHFVDEKLDHGPIVSQKAIEIEEGETKESLLKRIHMIEHDLLPMTIRVLKDKFE